MAATCRASTRPCLAAVPLGRRRSGGNRRKAAVTYQQDPHYVGSLTRSAGAPRNGAQLSGRTGASLHAAAIVCFGRRPMMRVIFLHGGMTTGGTHPFHPFDEDTTSLLGETHRFPFRWSGCKELA